MTSVTAIKKWKNFRILLQGNHMVWTESESCSKDKEHSELLAKRQQISMINTD
jgi:hypothetical protein